MAHFRQGPRSGEWLTPARSKPRYRSATALTSPHLLDCDLVPPAPVLAFLTVVIEDDGARGYDKKFDSADLDHAAAGAQRGRPRRHPARPFRTLALFVPILRRLHQPRERCR